VIFIGSVAHAADATFKRVTIFRPERLPARDAGTRAMVLSAKQDGA